MLKRLGSVILCGALAMSYVTLTGCQTAPETHADRQNLLDESSAGAKSMQREFPQVKAQLDDAYGYAIFPNVGKGGAIVAAEYGQGVVYEQGQHVGYANMTAVTGGLQAGGQTFSELIIFQTKEALDHFKKDNLEFAADASAVALKAGVAKSADFHNGVAVYTQPLGGLMFEAAIGGQKINYVPKDSPDIHNNEVRRDRDRDRDID